MASQVSITFNNETKTIDTSNVGTFFDIKTAQATGVCQYWPAAKTALVLLLASANAYLKIAIAVVIAAGDLVCPGGS